MSQFKRLGMGLGALLGDSEAQVPAAPAAAPAAAAEDKSTVPVDAVRPNPFQPRQEFDEADLRSLADSLKRQGFLQPIVVRPSAAGGFELVAGERRWRASKLAGFQRIPAVIRPIDDKRMLELALIENIQRRDLNPMEKARAFRQLQQLNSWTQDQLSESVGMSRPAVANFMRLLDLPPEIQEAVSRGTVSMGHARALLAVAHRARQMQLLKMILEEDLSVRALEKMVAVVEPASKKPAARRDAHVAELEQKLMDKLGFRAEIQPKAIVIPYGSNQELTTILRRLGAL